MNRAELHPRQWVARWYDQGAGWGYTRQPLRVIRVNRLTVTVETNQGSRFRIDADELFPIDADEIPQEERCN